MRRPTSNYNDGGTDDDSGSDNDASTDNTESILKNLASEFRQVRYVNNPPPNVYYLLEDKPRALEYYEEAVGLEYRPEEQPELLEKLDALKFELGRP